LWELVDWLGVDTFPVGPKERSGMLKKTPSGWACSKTAGSLSSISGISLVTETAYGRCCKPSNFSSENRKLGFSELLFKNLEGPQRSGIANASPGSLRSGSSIFAFCPKSRCGEVDAF